MNHPVGMLKLQLFRMNALMICTLTVSKYFYTFLNKSTNAKENLTADSSAKFRFGMSLFEFEDPLFTYLLSELTHLLFK